MVLWEQFRSQPDERLVRKELAAPGQVMFSEVCVADEPLVP